MSRQEDWLIIIGSIAVASLILTFLISWMVRCYINMIGLKSARNRRAWSIHFLITLVPIIWAIGYYMGCLH